MQRKRHIKIEFCVSLTVLRLFHVGHVVQSRRSTLSHAWHEWFSCKGKEWKIYYCGLVLSSELQKSRQICDVKWPFLKFYREREHSGANKYAKIKNARLHNAFARRAARAKVIVFAH